MLRWLAFCGAILTLTFRGTKPLRQKPDLFNQFNVIYPVQPMSKNISVLQNEDRTYICSIPSHQRGVS
jgi:hypothetical protein